MSQEYTQNLRAGFDRLNLPELRKLERTEAGLAKAFLKSARILHRQLERVEAAVQRDKEPDTLSVTVAALFARMVRHYYSHTALEVYRDTVASRFVLDQLYRVGVTMLYLIEKPHGFETYVAESQPYLRRLVDIVEEQLVAFPEHGELVSIRQTLRSMLNRQGGPVPLKSADNLDERARWQGLQFLSDPARKIRLLAPPGSWLDLQLENSRAAQVRGRVNFTHLRDAAHLCLHVTQALLEADDLEVAGLNQRTLNTLFEWFYEAHALYESQVRSVN
ncbi:hypothetical protein [Gloeobacter violaceus]|uniref:Glr0451 protein n=1 Tax=Gloeobacter violaceus (strain ATCC 29082 / PCC 7421) TaxID=251221 RepID=Q7NNG0_GLOVI|nr:hypothetical protein [Gloeobacter violaceus]BAC88392.1 glr0451 [Gloeobacter violaceus PCC 7421]